MRTRDRRLFRWMLLLVSLPGWAPARAEEPRISCQRLDDRIVFHIDRQPVATYVFRDSQVSRPYFAHVRTRSGIQVSRRHPPQDDVDAMDHVGLHAGIWLSFGDLSGHDYWRMKARTEHVRFLVEPRVTDNGGTFAVLNRYWSADGQSVIAEEECGYTIVCLPSGFRLEWNARFTPVGETLAFGDQEEMGLGMRLATPLAVDRRRGGRLTDDQGRVNERQVWGQNVDWVDYAGPLEGQWVGMTLMASPRNFRRCWAHARDYGFATLNPFGRKSLGGLEESRVVVRRGEKFELAFAVVVHESQTAGDVDLAQMYRDYVARADSRP